MSDDENENLEQAVDDNESTENDSAENQSSDDSEKIDQSETADEASDDKDLSTTETDHPTFEPSFEDEVLNEYVRAALAPIHDDHPCGESEDAASSVISQIETTGDSIHENLRTAFGDAIREDSPSSFDMPSVGRNADTLVEQIIECLNENCKSIILASYLPHLLLIGHGPEGFTAGLTIVRELTLKYGSQIFPRDKERLGSFLRRGVYVGNDDKVTDNYKLFLYLPITEQENLPYALLRNAKLKGSGSGIEGSYSADASRSTPDFYVRLIDNGLQKALETARETNLALGELLGDISFELVSFTFIESVERMVLIVRNLATENCPDYPPVDEDEPAALVADSAAPAAAQPMTGEIVDRDQAIKMLTKIADFFYKTERHSPISYRIRDTVRWCKMDFPELLELLLDGDESSFNEMQKRVGFDDPSSDSNDDD